MYEDYKIIKTGQEARQALKKGIDAVADVVKHTLGSKGRNVVIGNQHGEPTITNDGVSIAKEIILEDEIENLGAEILKDVASKTNDDAGDGTTTATVLAQAIINKGFKMLEDENKLGGISKNPMDIKREIDVARETIITELKKTAKKVKNKEELKQIATASMEDEKIGEIIADTVHKVGEYGVVTTEDGDVLGVHAEIVEGMKIKTGYELEYMANKDDKAIVNDAHILITNQSIESVAQILELTKQLAEKKVNELVIVADNFSQPVLASFVESQIKGEFRVLAISAPADRENTLTDLAIVTGGKYVDSRTGYKINDVSIEDLGRCKKVIATEDRTTFIGGVGDTKEHIKTLKNTETSSKYEKSKIEERIARLSGGVGVIKVLARTETEQGYLKDKVEDAINATKAANEEGIVKGGGLALKELSERLGDNILSDCIKAPYEQIQANAGGSLDIPDSVIDPVKVTRSALENACSLAGTVITAESAIQAKRKKKDD